MHVHACGQHTAVAEQLNDVGVFGEGVLYVPQAVHAGVVEY